MDRLYIEPFAPRIAEPSVEAPVEEPPPVPVATVYEEPPPLPVEVRMYEARRPAEIEPDPPRTIYSRMSFSASTNTTSRMMVD
jgi:hypothetical protein